MHDLKEKLVELLDYAKQIAGAKCYGYVLCNNCPNRKYEGRCKDIFMSEELIANGVTIQKLDGCEYCKEDREGYRKMFGAFSVTNPFHGSVWNIETCHCKPRQIFFCPMCGRNLPTPPKGE